jgi:GxxExxY protein
MEPISIDLINHGCHDNTLKNNKHVNIILEAAKRVYDQLKCGHNERIYHKALVYELMCLGYNLDTEMNIIVKYKDTKGIIHNLETERIDIFIHEHNILLELKAIQKHIQNQEKTQIEKYINELNKLNITVSNALVINFPQSNNKDTPYEIEYFIM